MVKLKPLQSSIEMILVGIKFIFLKPEKSKFVTNIFTMAAPSLDNEFMQYWSMLTLVEKESLMNVAKNYVLLKEKDDLSDTRTKLILAERAAYLRGEGKGFSWKEVKEMALKKHRRNEL